MSIPNTLTRQRSLLSCKCTSFLSRPPQCTQEVGKLILKRFINKISGPRLTVLASVAPLSTTWVQLHIRGLLIILLWIVVRLVLSCPSLAPMLDPRLATMRANTPQSGQSSQRELRSSTPRLPSGFSPDPLASACVTRGLRHLYKETDSGPAWRGSCGTCVRKPVFSGAEPVSAIPGRQSVQLKDSARQLARSSGIGLRCAGPAAPL